MDEALRAIAEVHGVFLTREARELGWGERAVTAAVRHGLWHRVRRGAFVPADVWKAADLERRHLIVAAAIHRSYGDRVAFSHTTAALMLGLAVWGADLRRVHVTRLDAGAGRTERDVVHHEGFCLAPADVVRHEGCLLTTPTRAALETGILLGTEGALVVLDSLLHQRLGSVDDLATAYDVVQHWPRTQHLQVAVRMADGRAESPGESRARWLFRSQGLPMPELQFEVRDETGRVIGISDFAWRKHRTLGEFDGRAKYERLLKPGQVPADAVWAEKQREDAMRRTTGYGMLRLIWVDLDRPALTAQRARQQLQIPS